MIGFLKQPSNSSFQAIGVICWGLAGPAGGTVGKRRGGAWEAIFISREWQKALINSWRRVLMKGVLLTSLLAP
jgi:nicotinamide mononucleotide (NMN) deamidase PncC